MPEPSNNLCDVCTSPGACCKNFMLTDTFWADEGDEGVMRRLAGYDIEFAPRIHPFIPGQVVAAFQDDNRNGRAFVLRTFRCMALDTKGRCTIYDRRPHPCRAYEAGSDGLCVMSQVKPDQAAKPD
jgi:Fe-S-cluster containining protein